MDLDWMLDEYDGVVYISDMDTYDLVYMNREGRKILGWEEEPSDGQKCYEVLQGRQEPCPFCTNEKLCTDSFYRWKFMNPHLGKTFLCRDREFSWNGRRARIEFAADITSNRASIARQEHERSAILRSVPGGIARLDARDLTTIIWYGANYLSILGYTEEEFENELHRKIDYVYPDDAPMAAAIMNDLVAGGEGPVIAEMRITHRSGQIRNLMTSFSYEDIQSSLDGIASIYSIGIDITDLKMEQERQRAALEDAYHAARSANAAKSDFLSTMSHDIRTPINAIMGMTAIARSAEGDWEKVNRCLRKIESSNKLLLGLINEVLDMGQIESGKLELSMHDFELADLIQNAGDLCRPLMEEKGHEFWIRVEAGIEEKLIGDTDRLQQVLLNLLSNAAKYTPPGGKITLSIGAEPTTVSETAVYSFTVTDNGIGISEEYQQHIFEPFSRARDSRSTKIQGSGLGLAITENIIHMMNGVISVKSEPNAGAQFTVSIPLHLQQDTEAKELLGCTVLVKDHDEASCADICRLLAEMGVESQIVRTKGETVRLLKEKNDGTRFSAILINGEKTGNGAKTVRSIREEVGSEIPVLMIRDHDSTEEEIEYLKAGVSGFLVRPLFRSRLQATLKHLLFPQNAASQAVENPFNFSGRHFLLVEDNEINQEIALELLSMRNADIDIASNGQEALERFIASPVNYYDLILMDIQMPIMNGYEATRYIRALDRLDAAGIPIIALTANAFLEDIKLAKKAGMNGHVAKPLDIDILYQTMAEYLK